MDLEQIFLALVNRSLAATWLVAAVLVLRLALRRAPKWTRCLLWALVAVRLMFSLSIPSPWSAFNLVDAPVNEGGEIEYAEYMGQGVKPVASFERPTLTVTADAPEGQPPVAVEREQELVYLPPFSHLWLAGVAAMLGYALVSYLRLRRRVAASVPLEGGVYRCDGVDSPFILGVLRPCVYVPSGLGGAQLGHVLAHERAHLARRDHWWKPFAFTLLSIYWFNPALWLAYVLLCRDIELACDERVYRDMALAERADYSQTLLDQSCSRFRVAACPLAFGEVSVKERVKAALHYKRPAFWVLLAAVIVCAAAAVCLLTNPQTLRVDFARDDILRVEAYHAETAQDVGTRELDGVSGDLYERLSALKGLRRGSYEGMTPLYTLTLYVENKGFFQIRGYHAGGTKTEIYYQDGVANKGKTWRVTDDAFGEYVMRLCRYGDAEDFRWSADLDGDGVTEYVVVDQLGCASLTTQGYAALRLEDAQGNQLADLGGISTSHTGWRTLALCELDGRTYLLEYSPTMFQGEATYRYELDELYDGTLPVVEQGSVAFSANPGKSSDNDAEAMRRFRQRANELWSASRLLVTTDQEVLANLYDGETGEKVRGGSLCCIAPQDRVICYYETMLGLLDDAAAQTVHALIVRYDNDMLSQDDLDALGEKYGFRAVRNFGRGDLFSAYFDGLRTDAEAEELIERLSKEPGILQAIFAEKAPDADGGEYRFEAEVVGYGNDTLRVKVLAAGGTLSVGDELYVPAEGDFADYPISSVVEIVCSGAVVLDVFGDRGVERVFSVTPVKTPVDTGFFSAVAGDYLFLSGAGAWKTEMHLNADGSFTGRFRDQDLSTVYYCDFSGRFGGAARVNDYTWLICIMELTASPSEGEERVENDVRWIGAQPYGLDGTVEMLVYLPGAPVDALPEDFIHWYSAGLPYGRAQIGDELPSVGLYSVKAGYGWFAQSLLDQPAPASTPAQPAGQITEPPVQASAPDAVAPTEPVTDDSMVVVIDLNGYEGG